MAEILELSHAAVVSEFRHRQSVIMDGVAWYLNYFLQFWRMGSPSPGLHEGLSISCYETSASTTAGFSSLRSSLSIFQKLVFLVQCMVPCWNFVEDRAVNPSY